MSHARERLVAISIDSQLKKNERSIKLNNTRNLKNKINSGFVKVLGFGFRRGFLRIHQRWLRLAPLELRRLAVHKIHLLVC